MYFQRDFDSPVRGRQNVDPGVWGLSVALFFFNSLALGKLLHLFFTLGQDTYKIEQYLALILSGDISQGLCKISKTKWH